MIWRFCNATSKFIAGFFAKDRLSSMAIHRSLSISIYKFLSISFFCFSIALALYLACVIFNIGDVRSKILGIFTDKARQMHNLSFGILQKKSPMVSVSDLKYINKIEIEDIAYRHTASKNIAMINLDDIYKDIKQNPLVKDVYIRRYFDNRIKIIVFEKQVSYIIYLKQNGKTTTLIADEDGGIVSFDKIIPNGLREMPSIYTTCGGKDFEAKLLPLQRAVLQFKDLHSQIASLDLFECLSWTVTLKNGTKLLLADDDESGSFHKYYKNLELINQINKKIESIDLRFEGKIYIKKGGDLDLKSIQATDNKV